MQGPVPATVSYSHSMTVVVVVVVAVDVVAVVVVVVVAVAEVVVVVMDVVVSSLHSRNPAGHIGSSIGSYTKPLQVVSTSTLRHGPSPSKQPPHMSFTSTAGTVLLRYKRVVGAGRRGWGGAKHSIVCGCTILKEEQEQRCRNKNISDFMCDETKSAFLPKFSTQTHCRSNGDGRKKVSKVSQKKKKGDSSTCGQRHRHCRSI